jgi:hypothetical protein
MTATAFAEPYETIARQHISPTSGNTINQLVSQVNRRLAVGRVETWTAGSSRAARQGHLVLDSARNGRPRQETHRTAGAAAAYGNPGRTVIRHRDALAQKCTSPGLGSSISWIFVIIYEFFRRESIPASASSRVLPIAAAPTRNAWATSPSAQNCCSTVVLRHGPRWDAGRGPS